MKPGKNEPRHPLPALGRMARVGFLLLALVQGGCTGAKHLNDGHLAYNEAVRVASDRELLLNIVRLRYLDSLEFLSIASINSTVSFSVGLQARAGTAMGNTDAGAGASVGYSSSPTFSFAPQRGGDFAARLTEPVDISTLAFLASVNRDTHEIFRLWVTWMNGLDNREGRVDARFIETTQTLTELQFEGHALIGIRDRSVPVTPPVPASAVTPSQMLEAVKAGLGVQLQAEGREVVFTRQEKSPVLFISQEAADRSSLLAKLRLDPDLSHHPVRAGSRMSTDVDERVLSVRTRSLLHSMAFLTQGVDVPGEHLSSGAASSVWPHPTVKPVPMDDIFRVRHSKNRPDDRSVSVQHRGYWFYIPDGDSTSKRTFFLLTEAFRFSLEHDAHRAPVLTLPVGAR